MPPDVAPVIRASFFISNPLFAAKIGKNERFRNTSRMISVVTMLIGTKKPDCSKTGLRGLCKTKVSLRHPKYEIYVFLCINFLQNRCHESRFFHRTPHGEALPGEQTRGDGAYRRGVGGCGCGGDDPCDGRHHGVQTRGGAQDDGLRRPRLGDRRAGRQRPRFGARAPQRAPRRADPRDRRVRWPPTP